ncbi:MAG: hypothetical protein PVF45_06455 [Anaerolineae bacterium]|jgi:hypothetical protein
MYSNTNGQSLKSINYVTMGLLFAIGTGLGTEIGTHNPTVGLALGIGVGIVALLFLISIYDDHHKNRSPQEANYMGVGIAIGVGLGVALGAIWGFATDKLAFFSVGISMGVGIGIAIGARMNGRNRENSA